MACRLCGSDRPLIDAHIIPRPFFVDQKAVGRSGKVLSNAKGQFPKRLPVGFYDSTILCGPCDNSLGRWDEYGIELLLRGLPAFQPSPSLRPVLLRLPEYDYKRLKLFLLSVLWRAGESGLDMFRRVRLGPYAAALREMLLAEEPGAADAFTTVLSAFIVGGSVPPDGLPIMDPFAERWGHVKAYRVSLGVVTAYIKVDRAIFDETLRPFALKPGSPLEMVTRDFATSSEAGVGRMIANLPVNQRAFGRVPRDV